MPSWKLTWFNVRVRYLFSNGLNFVDIRDSTMDLLISCLTYLCYDTLNNTDLDADQMRINLLEGKYRLHVFASSMWFDLAKHYARLVGRDESRLGALNVVMQNMWSELTNPNFSLEPGDENGHPSPASLQPGAPQAPWLNAPEFVSQTLKYLKDSRKDLWTSKNSKRRLSMAEKDRRDSL